MLLGIGQRDRAPPVLCRTLNVIKGTKMLEYFNSMNSWPKLKVRFGWSSLFEVFWGDEDIQNIFLWTWIVKVVSSAVVEFSVGNLWLFIFPFNEKSLQPVSWAWKRVSTDSKLDFHSVMLKEEVPLVEDAVCSGLLRRLKNSLIVGIVGTKAADVTSLWKALKTNDGETEHSTKFLSHVLSIEMKAAVVTFVEH